MRGLGIEAAPREAKGRPRMRRMVVEKQQQATTNARPVTFVTTQWSVVAGARNAGAQVADDELRRGRYTTL